MNGIITYLNNHGTLFLHILEKGLWNTVVIEHWNESFEDGMFRHYWDRGV